MERRALLEPPTFSGSHAWARIVYSPAMLPLLAVIVAIHALSAAGQVCLVRAAQMLSSPVPNQIGSAGLVVAYLTTWMGCNALNLPANCLGTKCKLAAYLNFLEHIASTNRGRVCMFSDRERARRLDAKCSAQGRQTIDHTIEFLGKTIFSTLGALTNAFTLSYLVSSWLGIAFCLTLLASLGALLRTRARRQQLAGATQMSRTLVDELTCTLSDNILLPNRYNAMRWEQSLHERYTELRRAQTQEALYSGLWNDISAAAAALPLIYVMLMVSRLGPEQAAAVLASAPRALVLLGDFKDMLAYLFGWPAIEAKMSDLLRESVPLDVGAWRHRLKALQDNQRLLSIRHKGTAYTLAQLRANPDLLRQSGRWTIRAPNGTGKSTLLQAIGEHFGEDAYYLPHTHRLQFLAPSGSAGEDALRQLEELGVHLGAQLILLDEWDKSMDDATTSRAEAIITHWAQTRSVVEVRHARRAQSTTTHLQEPNVL